jgi:hypothetical protein
MPDERITCPECGRDITGYKRTHRCAYSPLLKRILDVCANPPEHCVLLHNKEGEYGRVMYRGKRQKAHRVAYEIYYGYPIPDDLDGMHSCDVKPCFNPLHVSPGTAKDNIQDAARKGKMGPKGDNACKGERCHNAKLTEDDVRYIRANYVPRSDSARRLAKQFGISYAMIFRVVNRESWKHV